MTRTPDRTDITRSGEEAPEPDETPKQRIDRELIELLNELRVALPGAQVLFAFLLVLPFQESFAGLSDVQRDLYAGALLATAASIALIIAPSSYHRLNFRRPMKERMIRWSNKLLLAGLGFIVVGITLSVALVLDIALGDVPAIIMSVATAAWFGWFWFAVPLLRRREFEQDGDEHA